VPTPAPRWNWHNYAIEAASLGAFMGSALGFTLLLEHPASPLHAALPNPLLRRALMGCAMGATLAALVYNPLGQRSGAHLNPIFTLTFWRLGKVSARDALGYAAAQFAGAVIKHTIFRKGGRIGIGIPKIEREHVAGLKVLDLSAIFGVAVGGVAGFSRECRK